MYSFTVEQLVQKITQEYGIDQENAQRLARVSMLYTPQKFQQNIGEWVNGKKLTDICAGKYSIPMIMAIWKRQDFLKALFIVSELERGDAENAERQIWNMRR